MYNNKESESYKRKKHLQDVKRSITAINASQTSITDLQGKYVLLTNVEIPSHGQVNVIGEVISTKIHENKEIENTDKLERYCVSITLKYAYVFSKRYDGCFFFHTYFTDARWTNNSTAKLISRDKKVTIKEKFNQICNDISSLQWNIEK